MTFATRAKRDAISRNTSLRDRMFDQLKNLFTAILYERTFVIHRLRFILYQFFAKYIDVNLVVNYITAEAESASIR